MYPSTASLIERFLTQTQHLSQTEAASLAGVSQHTISRWRRGDRSPLRGNVRDSLERTLGVDGDGAASHLSLPDVSFLKPGARALYDRTVGSWVTRKWPAPIIERAAVEMLAVLTGAALRSDGQKERLSDDDQRHALEVGADEAEQAYGPDGVLRRR